MKSICRKCGVEKDLEEFHKEIREAPLAKWNLRNCKECARKEQQERYADPVRRLAQLNASKRWKQYNPDRHAELAREYRERNREKTKAHNSLNYAIRCGSIVRGACEKCGTTQRIHGHHDDYTQPLVVHWLCFGCHKAWHMILDPLKAEGEGKKVIDQVFKDFVVNRRSSPPT